MATLRFEIDTNSTYNEDEMEELQNEFSSWFSDVDGNAEIDTADVRFVGASGNENITAKALELIKSGTLHINISVKDDDEEEIFTTGETLIALS